MGACCCCASKGVGLNRSSGYYHYPVVSEEHEPLSSSHHVTPSVLSTGLLVNTNLETSDPDTYIPPPAPLPYDVNIRHPLTPSHNRETNAGEETNANDSLEISDKGSKGADCKVKDNAKLASSEGVEFEETDELKKSSEPYVPMLEEEDGCPICLDEYDDENPKLLTKCEHHFHLACILEWMERSDACPVCDKEVVIDPSIGS